jgi:hypothetical protein
VAGLQLGEDLLRIVEQLLVRAARKLDRSLDGMLFAGSRLPPELAALYKKELNGATQREHRDEVLSALQGVSFDHLVAAVDRHPAAAEAFADFEVLQLLHSKMFVNRRFWFEAVSYVGERLKERCSPKLVVLQA